MRDFYYMHFFYRYLCGTWMFRLMPPSYYSFAGGVDWAAVATQLLLQDGLQMLMHLGEHKVDALLGTNMWFYRKSHKPHHRFTNPKLFDAFNGSLSDTFFMILVPLLSTAHLCRTVRCLLSTPLTSPRRRALLPLPAWPVS